ncbi:unnamed protein product [Echinostoma caproni]|uniref:PDZ domain-containing protein n=1 Tax=Echinostoma caproni TaxID=27848 RepID=A0A183ASE0_9TREM|nr:unnamed protein product [Echinostoma caproni]
MHDHCYYDVDLIRPNNYDLGLGLCGARNADGKLAIVVSEIMRGSPAAGLIKAPLVRNYSNGLQASSMNQIATDQSQISLFTEEQSGPGLGEPYQPVDNHGDQAVVGAQKNNLFKTVHLNRRDNAESLGVELVSRIFVQSVDEGGLGECSGLRSGDRLVSLNGINAAHLSLVDTANMLRRQETVIEVARDPTIDPPLADTVEPNEQQQQQSGGYAKPHPHFVRKQRKHRDRYRPRPFARSVNDLQFSSLRKLPHDAIPVCRQCSATYSLDEGEKYQIKQQSDEEARFQKSGIHANTSQHNLLLGDKISLGKSNQIA